ncbi:MAG: 4-hydroxybenzoate octaprenyltransferase [Candidatus Berkiella sp.]
MHVLEHYWQLMRFHRPIGTLLLLWPTLSALWLANNGTPSFKLIIIFCLGVIITRAAGCIVNDIADRNFDGHVKRTQDRPLARRIISVRSALLLASSLCLIAFFLVCLTNVNTVLLSIVAVALLVVYPFMKRITHWPQVVLGAAFSWAIPMAYMASINECNSICWLLFGATVIWAVAYDTLYAMVDREDDLKIGIKSTAVLCAPYDRLLVFVCHGLVLGLYCVIGVQLKLSAYFFVAVFIGLLMVIYQQWLIRDGLPQHYFKAFLNNNWFGLLLFVGILLGIRL